MAVPKGMLHEVPYDGPESSISGILMAAEAAAPQTLRTSTFSAEKVVEGWKVMMQERQEAKQNKVAGMMEMVHWEVEGNRLLGQCADEDILNKLDLERQTFLLSFRNYLQNDMVTIAWEAVEVQYAADKFLYSNKDKMAYMRQAYPELEKWVEALGLEPL